MDVTTDHNYPWILIILGASVFVQVGAGLLTLRLMTTRRNRYATLMILGAMGLMAYWRIMTLSQMVLNPTNRGTDITTGLIALGVSLCLVAGLALFQPKTESESSGQIAHSDASLSYRGQKSDSASGDFVRLITHPCLYGQLIFDNEGRATDCRIVAINDAFEKIAGLGKPELIGRTLSECAGARPNLPSFLRADARRMQGLKHTVLTQTERKAEVYEAGLQRWFGITDLAMSPVHVLTVLEDVTHQKNVAANIRRGNSTVSAIERYTGTPPSGVPIPTSNASTKARYL